MLSESLSTDAKEAYPRPAVLKPIERLVDALIDPARRERMVLIVLAAYAIIWTLYGVIAKSSQDMQYDAAELVVWSHHPALGYAKHPPLASWLVHAWFSVFPIRDWSYYLLAMTYATVGLWICWRLFGHLLDSGKRIVALACLMLVPYVNFHALRFDENAILGPLWAATTLCFIRSYETRSTMWAALAGVAAAAAMLGKYWSVFLLAGLVLAALIDSRRGVYFRSRAPWITVAVGFIVLAPHLVWLVNSHFKPFSYAVDAHEMKTLAQSIMSTGRYLAGSAGYATVPALLVWGLTRPGRAAFIDGLWPQAPTRRLVAVAFWGPLLLPAVVALIFGLEFNSLWTMCGFVLMPVVLLSSEQLAVGRRAVVTMTTVAVALPLIMLAVSPGVALGLHIAGITPQAAHAKLLAERIEQEWRKSTDQPLRYVGGDLDLAYQTAFYLPRQVSAYPVMEPQNTPWVTPARIDRAGIALICKIFHYQPGASECRDYMTSATIKKIAAQFPDARRVEVKMTRSYFGIPGKPAYYLIYVAPPPKKS